MRKYNVLVTGVGAIIGYGVIKSLRNSRYETHITGMDMYEDAVGQAWCDDFIQAIPAKENSYISFLKSTILQKSIDIVFFGTEQEILKVYDKRDELGVLYSKCVINSSSIIEVSEDKWLTYNFCVNNGFTSIESKISGEYQEIADTFGIPFIVKPRRSYASKDIRRIEDEESFIYWKKRMAEQFMAQRIVGDNEHEYTAATFGLGEGDCLKPIILKRKLSQEGATAKAQVVDNRMIEQEIYRYIELLKPVGPTNLQFREENGKAYLLEFNPRISASTSIRTAFGYNEAEMCIQYFVEHEKPSEPKIRRGKAVRYISDWIMNNDCDNI